MGDRHAGRSESQNSESDLASLRANYTKPLRVEKLAEIARHGNVNPFIITSAR